MPTKILMVCLGNICRSPLAEGILASKLPTDNFTVDSAGTGSWHVDQSPDKRSIAVAKKHHLDISKQKGRQFKKADFTTFDYIFVMDKSNYNDVLALTDNQQQRDKVKLILNELHTDKNLDVPDPYFGIENGFEKVYSMLDEACTIIADKLLRQQK
ncbi:low molecular weight protein-tyrosine-phosphatase [Flavobacterium sp. 14A]|uniref:low molecular weight protein-tyrosine-phosphatase n=1 Tax=Flavobacterium sp. 14A TaxID=2735896 RepID=UPI00156E92E6|nr:low molecular weight protein-tyrosine-phosphatase [Flavobacterium sp. 14A]NRT11357.1 protein-tyrosine phosphatase [Flavobacterium sp. 14A]